MGSTLPWLHPAAAVAFAALSMLPAAASASRRGWALAFVATLAMCLGLWTLPAQVTAARAAGPTGSGLAWIGPLLAAAAALWVAWLSVHRLGLPWHAFGLHWRQQPGAWPVAATVSAAALALHAWVTFAAAAAQPQATPPLALPPALLLAMLPAVAEEWLFRGVLLALADRAYTARWKLFGAPVGFGGALVTLLFVALHGATPGSLVGVAPAAVLYLWLRLRTGSLVAPVLVHAAWNLLVLAAAA